MMDSREERGPLGEWGSTCFWKGIEDVKIEVEDDKPPCNVKLEIEFDVDSQTNYSPNKKGIEEGAMLTPKEEESCNSPERPDLQQDYSGEGVSIKQECELSVKRSPARQDMGIHLGEIAQCDASLGRKSLMRQHAGENPFSCDLCEVTFAQKGSLTKHKKIHTLQNLLPCDQCGKEFVDGSRLATHKLMHKRHVGVHLRQAPYKTISYPHRFGQHMLTYKMESTPTASGGKPFDCDQCASSNKFCHHAFRKILPKPPE